MAKVKFTDEALERAATAVGEAMLAALPGRDACGHVFSPGFERKMAALVEREKRRGRTRKLVQRAAAVILAVLVGLGGWLAVDQEARAAFFGWVREVYETHIVYRFNGEASAGELPVYRIGWLPEGYEEVSSAGTDTMWGYVYRDQDTDLTFMYHFMSEGEAGRLSGVDSEGEPLEVNGHSGHFYIGTEESPSNALIWVDEDQDILFMLSGLLSCEDMLHIAEGIYLEDMAGIGD